MRDETMGAALIGALCGLALSACVLAIPIHVGWQMACVRHGAAEYNQTTGAWQWKEPGTE